MSDPEQTKLLTEIRDLLVAREKMYAEYIAEARRALGLNTWRKHFSSFILMQWFCIFVVVYTAVYLAVMNAQ